MATLDITSRIAALRTAQAEASRAVSDLSTFTASKILENHQVVSSMLQMRLASLEQKRQQTETIVKEARIAVHQKTNEMKTEETRVDPVPTPPFVQPPIRPQPGPFDVVGGGMFRGNGGNPRPIPVILPPPIIPRGVPVYPVLPDPKPKPEPEQYPWQCLECTVVNPVTATHCECCGALKTGL